MANSGKKNWNFQTSATTTGDGFELWVDGDFQTINLEISGTATSSTVVFEGKSLDNGSWYAISCVNLSTLTLASQTTGKSELWQADLTGLIKFRTRISAISGGNLSVSGKVVG